MTHLKKDLCDLSAEVKGCSAISHLFYTLHENADDSDMPTNSVMADAMFGLEWYLERIADDISELSGKAVK